jgi:hypothetical protein
LWLNDIILRNCRISAFLCDRSGVALVLLTR